MWTRIAPIAIVLLFSAGCTPLSLNGQPVSHPNLHNVRKIAILPPRIDVSEIGAGGIVEKIDDWSQKAVDNVFAAIEAELKARSGVESRRITLETLPDNLKSELQEAQLLFDAVNNSVLLHIYGPPPHRFEEQLVQFNYSLGSETARLQVDDVDALLMLKGFDQISSAGRKTFQTTAVLAAAALGVLLIPQMGATVMSAALVDVRSGDILWYNFDRSEGANDLRDPNSAALFVKSLFSQLRLP